MRNHMLNQKQVFGTRSHNDPHWNKSSP